MPTLLIVYFCLVSVFSKQTVSLCALPTYYAVSLTINLVAIFVVFASLKYPCFQTGERARRTLPVAPGGLAAKISAFHPGYPGPVPAQGIRSLLRTAYCCLSEIITKCNPQLSSPIGADTQVQREFLPHSQRHRPGHGRHWMAKRGV